MIFLAPNLGSFPPEIIIAIILGLLIGALTGMTVHEFAHNYVAHLAGDPTPASQGRLTLNPSVHINWTGFLMFVLIGFGILGQAPISAYRMRNPRLGYLAAVAAGPVSNLLLAVVYALVFRIFNPPVFSVFWQFMYIMITMNVLLFVFNLLPLAPLDGWHIVYSLLPPDQAYTWERWAPYTQYAFLFLILLSFMPILPIDPLNILIGQPISFITRILLGF